MYAEVPPSFAFVRSSSLDSTKKDVGSFIPSSPSAARARSCRILKPELYQQADHAGPSMGVPERLHPPDTYNMLCGSSSKHILRRTARRQSYRSYELGQQSRQHRSSFAYAGRSRFAPWGRDIMEVAGRQRRSPGIERGSIGSTLAFPQRKLTLMCRMPNIRSL